MNVNDVNSILNENGVKILEELEFASKKDTLDFLKKFEMIKNKNIDLHFMDNSLKNVISQIELNGKNFTTLKKFNFKRYINFASNVESNERFKRIYYEFLEFILAHLGANENKLYITKENFDEDNDTKTKAKKFGVEVLFDYSYRGKKNTVNDFVLYFNKRLEHFNSVLEEKVELEKLMRISSLEDMYGNQEEVNIIGLISDISKTKNGHIVFTLEDKSAEVKCFVNKNKLKIESFKNKIENMCLDEGIAVKGKVGDNIVWVDDVVMVSADERELKKTDDENYVVCLGDLHVGSRNFADESFEKFIDWINARTGNEKLNQIAKKVKYIIVVGDMIEGLGVYPGQGKDATILSTQMQYDKAAQLLSKIPKDKCIINICGNHDTSRLSEPQPKLSYHKASALYNMKNVINLSNPCIIRLFGGLDFYLYHGGSIFYYADNIQKLREAGGARVPEKVIQFLLEKKHIAPSHGSTLYVPDSQVDPLKIEKLPDFFVAGHTHKVSCLNHKGCSILCCGCWNTITDYQEKMGMYPDVGKCLLINTKTRNTKILNFHKEIKSGFL